MSITNFINSEASTIVQGVNGIRLCQESWMIERQNVANLPCSQEGSVQQRIERVTYKDRAVHR